MKLYTTKGCPRCEMVKRVLSNREIQFRTIQFDELTGDEQSELIQRATEIGIGSFPIIENNDGSLCASIPDEVKE